MQALRGKVTFEQVKPEDLVDVAGSVSGSDRQNTCIDSPGMGVDELLKWSLCEVRLAREATSASDRNRCATNALLSGRRALACLVEWYLARDYLSLCKDAPRRAEEKAKLLQDRGLLDDLTSSVLPRAVQERDKAEHQFVAATLEQAEDFAELMRRTIQGLRAESDPSQRPFLFGSMSYRVGLGAFGQSAEFFGWKNPCFLLCPFETTPWLGAIVPDKFDPAAAVVRRTFFAEISTELLLQVLRILEQNFGPSHGSMTSALARLILVECGLISNG